MTNSYLFLTLGSNALDMLSNVPVGALANLDNLLRAALVFEKPV